MKIDVPEWFVKAFLTHRHFWAAKDIDVVAIARKDGKEYRLEADWLKNIRYEKEKISHG